MACGPFQRYAKWLEGRTNMFVPDKNAAEPPDSEPSSSPAIAPLAPASAAAARVEKIHRGAPGLRSRWTD